MNNVLYCYECERMTVHDIEEHGVKATCQDCGNTTEPWRTEYEDLEPKPTSPFSIQDENDRSIKKFI